MIFCDASHSKASVILGLKEINMGFFSLLHISFTKKSCINYFNSGVFSIDGEPE